MNIMRYEIIDHTADFGIEVWGADLKELFENAAYAMFDTLTDTEELNALSEISVNVTGEDWPDLMVNWLRELLYLWAGKGLLVKTARISSISEYALSAVVKYESFVPGRHLIKSELKSVTFHQFSVEPEETNWKARIIFDV